ncbi:MAG: tRNA lysidine(34) synthetase TilS [Thermoleophilia bacterium]
MQVDADPAAVRARVEAHVREHDLIPPGGEVVCLVSGGPDSSCLWHALAGLGYAVSAVHVDHGLRGAESDADARHCADVLGAEVVRAVADRPTEAELRRLRYAVRAGALRATGHTASDQVETILYRLATSGTTRGIRRRREDGVVRPLLPLWREETAAYCAAVGLPVRHDSSNADTVRGLLRDQVLPALRRLHPAAERNVLAAAEREERLPAPVERALAELLAAPAGSRRAELGGGLVAVREHDRVWTEPAARRLVGPVTWGEWTIEPCRPGLVVRAWRAGDRLAGGAKVQDVFVDARVPRSERHTWPLVVRGDAVVVVPGLIAAPGYDDAVVARRQA